MASETRTDEPAVAVSERVVVGFDGSDQAIAAVRWAAAEASRKHCALRIVTAFGPDVPFANDEEARESMEKLADRAVAEAEDTAPGITVEHRAHQDLPSVVLRAESRTAELLVVGSRGRGGFSGLLLGSVSRTCVQGAKCPVVVVRPLNRDHPQPDAAATATPAASPAPRIVVGIDGSHSSNAALVWAADEAEAAGARLELVATWQLLTGVGWTVSPADFDPRRDATSVMDEAVEPMRTVHPTLEISTVIEEGHAAEVLVHASEGADLLVVGSRGHGELAGMLLGSVSEHCVTHAHCPVVVMRGADR